LEQVAMFEPEALARDRRAILKAIRRLARAVDIQSRRIDREAGLTLPQFVVLSSVRDLRSGTSTQIAHEADLSPATVVGILDKLESKGLIARVRSTVDRRSVHSSMTDAGSALLDRIPNPLGAAFEAAFAALPAETRSRTISVLDELAALAAPKEVSLGETWDGR
jgi:DNA-binding MarR family transcriptional regulator